jgi:hypothetical protein
MTDPLRQLEAEIASLRTLRERTLAILREEGSDPAAKLQALEALFQAERDFDVEAEEFRDRERLS